MRVDFVRSASSYMSFYCDILVKSKPHSCAHFYINQNNQFPFFSFVQYYFHKECINRSRNTNIISETIIKWKGTADEINRLHSLSLCVCVVLYNAWKLCFSLGKYPVKLSTVVLALNPLGLMVFALFHQTLAIGIYLQNRSSIKLFLALLIQSKIPEQKTNFGCNNEFGKCI